MKTLLVLRHAKSSWETPLRDHERPLNARGRRDAPRMGALIAEQQLTPDLVVSSDAVRARDTAEAVAESAEYRGEIVFDHRLYHADTAAILEVLRTAGTAASVMIVGHNPGLEEIVAHLTGEEHDLPTAALAQIALPIERWSDLASSTRGRLLGLWRARELD